MLSSTPSSTASQPNYLMYDEENNAADHKINDETNRMILGVSSSSSDNIGMSIGTTGTTASTTARLPGYWQHAATSAAGYWSSLFDSWTTGSQSLSLTWDENRG
ncbi:uncharacterized protein LOC122848136 [Aphidius gifuensis]|uniref:uncharacterized protein LOC122848136 n=1 Tax=Aphidius gifuensis TaxID=684658 RepID=UPI001CDC3C22|nr:uncharacterized protein LOC122848136 [Aphidius gifuensis]